MVRPRWKPSYVHKSLFKNYIRGRRKNKGIHSNVLKLIADRKTKIMPWLHFWKRNSMINKNLLGRKICVYNGKRFFFTIIKKPHLEFRLSALYATWKHPNHSGKIKNVKAKKSYSILKEKKNHFLKKKQK